MTSEQTVTIETSPEDVTTAVTATNGSFPVTVPDAIKNGFATVLCLQAFLKAVGNVFVLYVLCRSGLHRRTPSAGLAINIAVSDILLAAALMLQACLLVHDEATSSEGWCLSYALLMAFSSLAVQLSLLLVVAERFISIKFPFHYSRLVKPRNVVLAVCVVWVYSLLIVLLSIHPVFIHVDTAPVCLAGEVLDRNYVLLLVIHYLVITLVSLLANLSVTAIACRQNAIVRAARMGVVTSPKPPPPAQCQGTGDSVFSSGHEEERRNDSVVRVASSPQVRLSCGSVSPSGNEEERRNDSVVRVASSAQVRLSGDSVFPSGHEEERRNDSVVRVAFSPQVRPSGGSVFRSGNEEERRNDSVPRVTSSTQVRPLGGSVFPSGKEVERRNDSVARMASSAHVRLSGDSVFHSGNEVEQRNDSLARLASSHQVPPSGGSVFASGYKGVQRDKCLTKIGETSPKPRLCLEPVESGFSFGHGKEQRKDRLTKVASSPKPGSCLGQMAGYENKHRKERSPKVASSPKPRPSPSQGHCHCHFQVDHSANQQACRCQRTEDAVFLSGCEELQQPEYSAGMAGCSKPRSFNCQESGDSAFVCDRKKRKHKKFTRLDISRIRSSQSLKAKCLSCSSEQVNAQQKQSSEDMAIAQDVPFNECQTEADSVLSFRHENIKHKNHSLHTVKSPTEHSSYRFLSEKSVISVQQECIINTDVSTSSKCNMSNTGQRAGRHSFQDEQDIHPTDASVSSRTIHRHRSEKIVFSFEQEDVRHTADSPRLRSQFLQVPSTSGQLPRFSQGSTSSLSTTSSKETSGIWMQVPRTSETSSSTEQPTKPTRSNPPQNKGSFQASFWRSIRLLKHSGLLALLFSLSWLPFVVVELLELAGFPRTLLERKLAQMFIFITPVSNPLIYVWGNVKFRKVFTKFCTRRSIRVAPAVRTTVEKGSTWTSAHM